MTPPTPGDGTVTTDTPAGPAVAPAVATPADAAAPVAAAAAVAAVEAIGDAENPLADITTIDDDANALAAFEEIHCWTHWLMLFGALVTIVYGLGVLYAVATAPATWTTSKTTSWEGSARSKRLNPA